MQDKSFEPGRDCGADSSGEIRGDSVVTRGTFALPCQTFGLPAGDQEKTAMSLRNLQPARRQ